MGKTRDALKLMVGRLAELARPDLAREIDAARNTDRAPRLKRAILYARLRRAQSAGDIAAIEHALAAFWIGDSGDRFHDQHNRERFTLFREQHAQIIDAIADAIERSGGGFSRLVEIGCGDGQVLAYAGERLPSLSDLIGLDINAAVIARAADRYSGLSRLKFTRAEAGDWLSTNPQPGTIVLSYGGVLEYVSQANFDRLLLTLGQAPPAMIALVEPVAREHDLDVRFDSFAFGQESSFSHHHAHRLNAAGFEISYAQELHHSHVRWMLMVAVQRSGKSL